MKLHQVLQLDLLGTGFEYVWEEMDKISNSSNKDSEINTSENNIEIQIDWTETYGELESGKYEILFGDDDSLGIRIFFTIDSDNISYSEPELLY